MKCLSVKEGDLWLAEHGLPGCWRLGSYGEDMAAARYRLFGDSGGKNGLAFGLARLLFAKSQVIHVQTEMGIWPSAENEHLFRKYREAMGETRDLHDAPLHILADGEEEVAATLLGLTLYFVQGCVSMRVDGSLGVVVSHDEWLAVFGSSQEDLKECQHLLNWFELARI